MDGKWMKQSSINPLEDENTLFGIFDVYSEGYGKLHTKHSPRLVSVGGLVICRSGECEVILNDRRVQLKRGDMLTVFPNTIIQEISKSDDLHAYTVAVNTEFLRSMNIPSSSMLYIMIRQNPCIAITEEQAGTIIELCELLRRKSNRTGHMFRKEICESLLMTICYEVAAMYSGNSDIKKRPQSRQDMILRQFLSLVSTDYLVNREVRYYADKLCITPKYLSIVIRSVSGRSATEWISHVIIINAKSMLIGTQMTIQQISNALNFPNPSFFGQYFRRHTGMTPKEYRRNARL